MHMHVYMCEYMYTHNIIHIIHACLYSMYTYNIIHIHACVYVHTYYNTHTCMCIYMYTHNIIHMHACMCICMCVHVHVHAYNDDNIMLI